MEKENYILRMEEAELISTKSGPMVILFRIISGILIAGTLFLFAFEGFSIFKSISFTGTLILFYIVRFTLGSKKEEYGTSVLEIRFYNDYLTFYRPKFGYADKNIRMEIIKVMYSDVERCTYSSNKNIFSIKANMYITHYPYEKTGEVSKTPSFNEYIKNVIFDVDTRFEKNINFKSIIESNSPIVVELR